MFLLLHPCIYVQYNKAEKSSKACSLLANMNSIFVFISFSMHVDANTCTVSILFIVINSCSHIVRHTMLLSSISLTLCPLYSEWNYLIVSIYIDIRPFPYSYTCHILHPWCSISALTFFFIPI